MHGHFIEVCEGVTVSIHLGRITSMRVDLWTVFETIAVRVFVRRIDFVG